MGTTKIEWAGKTWNPITGCTKISAGCKNCYAEKIAKRFAGLFGYPKDDPFRVTLHENKLSEPLAWKEPSMIFVCSMGDLFHAGISPSSIEMIFKTIKEAKQHIFMILTKRPANGLWLSKTPMLTHYWPLPNVWLGITAENEKYYRERISSLLKTPAALHFLSLEPLLEDIDLNITGAYAFRKCRPYPEWVIVGCESGPNRRPCKIEWVRSIVKQCKEFNIPVFVKQLDIDGRVSKDMSEWPEELRIRQWPTPVAREVMIA